MAIPVWGILEKAQDDDQKIGAAISAAIAAHEADPTSHLGDNESLKSHKASEIIDHLASSIVDDKIKDGELTTPKLDVACKVGDCVVAKTGGDYDNIQSAITAGFINIYVKEGVYDITSDITLLDKINIKGEDNKLVRFDFKGGTKQLKIFGTSILNKTNIVISGIEFFNCHDYAIFGNFVDFININDCRFVDCYGGIKFGDGSQKRSTNISIKNNYFNGGQSGFYTILLESNSTEIALPSYIEKNVFDNVDNNAVRFLNMGDTIGSRYYILNNLFRYDSKKTNGTVIYIINGWVVGNTIFKGHIGIDASFCPVLNNYLYDQNNYGIVVYDDVNKIIGNIIYSVDGGVNKVGIAVFNVQFIQIINNYLYDCKNKGIYLTTGSKCIVNNNIIKNSIVGIDLATGSEKNILLSNITGNCTTGIDDNGSLNEIAHNLNT